MPPVAQITVPPGETPVLPAVSPTPRAATPIETVERPTVTPTPTITVTPVPPSVTPTPTPELIGAAEEGRRQFIAMQCGMCHKADLSGNIGPKLSGRTPQNLSDDRIREQVVRGGGAMPKFEVSPQELQNFIAFIRSQA